MGGGSGLPLPPGTRLGPYRVDAVLARGSTGVVYRATDERFDRAVAVKCLAPSLVGDERARGRFLAEARAAARLDHPNVLPVHDAGETDGTLWIAMRLATGPDLREIIRRDGPLAPVRVVALLTGIASALDAAHDVGLLHRDVKPGNIVVAGDSRGEHVYLADFGLATLVHDRALTRTGELLGTVDYVSPEQARGDPLDARSDVYSLAAVAYEALTGRAPFAHLPALASLSTRLTDPPPSPSSLRPDLPPAADDVLLRGLAADPRARPASAGRLLGELRAALESPRLQGFMFADLRGYTAFTEREGDRRAAALLGRYRSLVREAIARADGAEVRTEGDSFYVVFPSVTSAIRAGLAIVEAARRASGDDPTLPIEVGVGINAGEPSSGIEGPIGGAVNVAARICSLARAGEVLVSATARALAAPAHEFAFEPRGLRAAKGIATPVQTWAVARAGTDRAPGPAPTGALDAPERRRRLRLVAVTVIGVVVLVAGLVATVGGAGKLSGASPDPSAAALGGTAPGDPPGGTAQAGQSPAGPTGGIGSPSSEATPTPRVGATPPPGVFPNESEQALLATLPDDLSRTCARGAGPEDARRAGWVGRVPTAYAGDPPTPVGYTDILPPAPIAGVTCRPAAGAARVFVQRQPITSGWNPESVADTAASYIAARWAADAGSCATDPAARQRWLSPGVDVGRPRLLPEPSLRRPAVDLFHVRRRAVPRVRDPGRCRLRRPLRLVGAPASVPALTKEVRRTPQRGAAGREATTPTRWWPAACC